MSTIVRQLHEDGPLSRSALVTRTGLTRSAIRVLIGEMALAGLVAEGLQARLGTPGRPSALVRLEPAGAVVLAFEIAVDSLAVALVGLGGTVIEMRRVEWGRAHSGVDEIAAALGELGESIRQSHAESERLIGIGVAVVGVVRRSDGFVSMAPNLGWRDVPLGAQLSRYLDLGVPIALANEADLGALAEFHRGVARGSDSLLFLSGEVGVGGGFIVDGKPLTGIAGYSGEVGHMPVNPNGLPCRCGSIGCWETEIGEDALLEKAGFPRGGGHAAIDELLRRAAEGSPAELAALDDVGRWLGLGLAGLVNMLNPGLIVLGGRFARVHRFVQTALEQELERRALAAPRALVRIVPATLGVDAPLLGAAELAFEPFLADPSAWMMRRDAQTQLRTA